MQRPIFSRCDFSFQQMSYRFSGIILCVFESSVGTLQEKKIGHENAYSRIHSAADSGFGFWYV